MGSLDSIKDWTFKSDWDFLPNAQHHLKFGLGYTKHSIIPIFESFDESEFEEPDGVDFENYELDDPEVIDAHYFYSFLENDWDLNNRLRLNAGFRFSLFHSQSKTYRNIEPRLAFQYSLSKNAKINGSITRMVQYIHLLVNEDLRVFSNIWLPSNLNLAPQSAWQGTTGMEFLKPTFSYGFEAYYKKVDNIYKDVFITQLGETPVASTN